MRKTPIDPTYRRILSVFLLLTLCILLSTYRLPDKIVVTQGSSLNYKVYYSFLGLYPPNMWNFGNSQYQSPQPTPLIKKPPVSNKAKVAIIIDDVGYNPSLIRKIAKIPIPLTWAFLPFTPYIKECLTEARIHGIDIMLHLPLEPLDVTNNPGPGFIRHDWNKNVIEQQFNLDLKEVPGAIGINNHMGSLGTRDPYLMDCLMKIIHKRDMFFIDSMTTSGSVVEKYAAKYKVPFARRRVFIDNQADVDSKKAALRELIRIALKDGSAIGIAHVKEGNAEAISRMIPEFTKAGIEFVPVSELAR